LPVIADPACRTHEKHLLKTINAAATTQTSIPDETNFSSKALEASESESVSTDIAKDATRPPLETTSGARLSLESPQKAEHSDTQSKLGLPNIATDEDGRAKLELNHLASDRKVPQSDHQGREKHSFGSLTQTSTIHAHTSKAAPSDDFRQRPEPHSPSNRHCATSPASAPATSFHTRTGFPASFSGSLSKGAAVHATNTSTYISTQPCEPPKTFSTSTPLPSFNSSTFHTNHQASSKASLPSNTTVQRNQSISQPFVGNSTVTGFVPQPQKFPSPARAEITTWFCCQCHEGPHILDLTQNCPLCGHLRDERCKGLHKSVSQFPTATVSSGPRPSRT